MNESEQLKNTFKECSDLSFPAISVVVATYNRGNLLNSALQTLCNQTLDACHYEILVVDNNSQDNTRAVTEKFERRYSNVRYCLETKQGTAHARNRAWQEAKGVYVGIFDDDSEAPKQWLRIAKDIIDRVSPSVFGGPFYPSYNRPKPRWYKDCYGSGEFGKEPKVLTRNHLFGTNIFFRRRLLQEVGGFDTSFGVIGDQAGYGDEVTAQQRIRKSIPNAIFYYDPRLYVNHLVRAEKLTLRWMLWDRFVRGGETHRLFHASSPTLSRAQMSRQFVRIILACAWNLKCLFRRDRQKYPYFQNYVCEQSFVYIKRLGALCQRYRKTDR